MTFPSEISGRAGTRTGHGVRELAVDLASEGRRFLPLWGIGPDLTDLFDDDGIEA